MEIFVLLQPEELTALHERGGNPIPHVGTHCVVAHPEGSNDDTSRPTLFVNGDGFSENVLALLKRRPEVVTIDATQTALTIELRDDANVAPLVSLLVESGAEVEEVYRRDGRIDDLVRLLLEKRASEAPAQ